MTRVNNRKIMHGLAVRELKTNRKMSVVVVISIILTCVLFTALTSIGGGLLSGARQETMRQVGGDSIKATPLANGVVKAKTGNNTGATTYTNWYNSVYMPTDVSGADVSLSALSIGSVSLSPTFDKDVTAYTATTSNATNTVTATATDSDASVVITLNGNSITSGSSVTWRAGANTVMVTVRNGGSSGTYTVAVTAED